MVFLDLLGVEKRKRKRRKNAVLAMKTQEGIKIRHSSISMDILVHGHVNTAFPRDFPPPLFFITLNLATMTAVRSNFIPNNQGAWVCHCHCQSQHVPPLTIVMP